MSRWSRRHACWASDGQLCRDSSLVFASDAAAPTMVAERVGAEGAAR